MNDHPVDKILYQLGWNKTKLLTGAKLLCPSTVFHPQVFTRATWSWKLLFVPGLGRLLTWAQGYFPKPRIAFCFFRACARRRGSANHSTCSPNMFLVFFKVGRMALAAARRKICASKVNPLRTLGGSDRSRFGWVVLSRCGAVQTTNVEVQDRGTHRFSCKRSWTENFDI